MLSSSSIVRHLKVFILTLKLRAPCDKEFLALMSPWSVIVRSFWGNVSSILWHSYIEIECAMWREIPCVNVTLEPYGQPVGEDITRVQEVWLGVVVHQGNGKSTRALDSFRAWCSFLERFKKRCCILGRLKKDVTQITVLVHQNNWEAVSALMHSIEACIK